MTIETSNIPKQIYLLMLLYANKREPIKGRTRLQKLMFLLEKEIVEKKGLDISSEKYLFEPYDYGPFSVELIDDILFLKDLGLIEIKTKPNPNENEEYRITPEGEKVLKNILEKIKKNNPILASELIEKIKELKKRWNKEDIRKLLYYVYRMYEDYTTRSEIREQLLQY